jgi:hypothetical protein
MLVEKGTVLTAAKFKLTAQDSIVPRDAKPKLI